ncbi:MAG: polyphosphate kinase 2 [Hyphomicrobiales bacterium]
MSGQDDQEPIGEEHYSLDVDRLHPEIERRAFASGGYPYDKKLKEKSYLEQLRLLQIELLKAQDWQRESGARIVVVFEGRDTAGKGGTIKRFMEHLNPRHAHVVALSKPTEAERGQWYFQRYAVHLPTAGDMALLDRSWYNRAGVERVMGFCTPEQTELFYREVPEFEHMLVRDDIHLFKFWLTIGREQQLRRLHRRKADPLKRWKLSPIDYKAVGKWADYTEAKIDMFRQSHTDHAPWTVIKATDKKRARLNCIRVVLSALDYALKDAEAIGEIDARIVGTGEDEIE